MNLEYRNQILQIIDECTKSNVILISHETVVTFIGLLKGDDVMIECAFNHLFAKIRHKHPQSRLLALMLINLLFRKSKRFRELTVDNLDSFFEYTLGINPKKPLPLPAKTAQYLMEQTVDFYFEWWQDFGDKYYRLTLGKDYLTKQFNIHFIDKRKLENEKLKHTVENKYSKYCTLLKTFETIKTKKINGKYDSIMNFLNRFNQCILKYNRIKNDPNYYTKYANNNNNNNIGKSKTNKNKSKGKGKGKSNDNINDNERKAAVVGFSDSESSDEDSDDSSNSDSFNPMSSMMKNNTSVDYVSKLKRMQLLMDSQNSKDYFDDLLFGKVPTLMLPSAEMDESNNYNNNNNNKNDSSNDNSNDNNNNNNNNDEQDRDINTSENSETVVQEQERKKKLYLEILNKCKQDISKYRYLMETKLRPMIDSMKTNLIHCDFDNLDLNYLRVLIEKHEKSIRKQQEKDKNKKHLLPQSINKTNNNSINRSNNSSNSNSNSNSNCSRVKAQSSQNEANKSTQKSKEKNKSKSKSKMKAASQSESKSNSRSSPNSALPTDSKVTRPSNTTNSKRKSNRIKIKPKSPSNRIKMQTKSCKRARIKIENNKTKNKSKSKENGKSEMSRNKKNRIKVWSKDNDNSCKDKQIQIEMQIITDEQLKQLKDEKKRLLEKVTYLNNVIIDLQNQCDQLEIRSKQKCDKSKKSTKSTNSTNDYNNNEKFVEQETRYVSMPIPHSNFDDSLLHKSRIIGKKRKPNQFNQQKRRILMKKITKRQTNSQKRSKMKIAKYGFKLPDTPL